MRFSRRISGKSCSPLTCLPLYTPMFERVDLMLLARRRPPSQMLVYILLHSEVSSQPKQRTVSQLFTNSNGDPHHASASSVSSSRSLRALGRFSWLTLGVSIPSYPDALVVRCLASCSGMWFNGNALGARAAFDVCVRGVGSNGSHQHSLMN